MFLYFCLILTKDMKHFKPIKTFDKPEDAYRYYITMHTILVQKEEQGLMRNMIWEVTLSSGSIHEKYSVFINIVKSDIDIFKN